MSEPAKKPDDSLIVTLNVAELRQIVREEVRNGRGPSELLTPEELAGKLKVPVSWVYEQSRQRNIPTHRVGRYVRFDLAEILESQKKKGPSWHPRALFS